MERKGFIGGSDMYSIVRGDWNTLWHVKTGRQQPESLSDQFNVQLGIRTESFNIEWLAKCTGWDVMAGTAIVRRKIAGVPYQARVDGIAYDNDGMAMVVECKHTASYRSMSDMLDAYLPQVHLYMRVQELDKAVFSVIFGNQWEYCVVDFNKDYWKEISTQAYQFWQMVEADVEPVQNHANKVDWSNVKIDGLVMRDASKDNQFMDAVHRFVDSSQTAKEHEAIKKELRSMVKDTEREVYCDLLTIKRDKRGACRITINSD
jgi:hypothetical protein